MEIHKILYESSLSVRTSKHKYMDIYDKLKPYLIQTLTKFLDSLKTTSRGRKRTINLDRLLTCMFSIADNGFKMSYIKDYFHIPKSTYYYYFGILSKYNFFKTIYDDLILYYNKYNSIKYLITDTFTVKSMDGSNGLGRSCTDRGRNGLKVSLICDQNLVTHAVHHTPANIHDSKILVPTIESSITNLKNCYCLADSGYAGSNYISNILKNTGVKLLSKPKRTCNKNKMSHVVSPHDLQMINERRNHIERLNGNIRRFIGLMIKYTKKVDSYLTYLYVALVCITGYNITKLFFLQQT